MELEYNHTIEDVAKMFNITHETVRRWCRDNKIKFIKLPGQKGEYRFSKEGIREFIAYLNSQPVEETQAEPEK